MKRHPVDPFSVVFGVAFGALGVLFFLTRVRVASLHLHWIWPVPLIVLGVLIIVLAGRRDRHGDDVISD